MFRKTAAKIKPKTKATKLGLVIAAALFTLIGGYFIIGSFAATPTPSSMANIWIAPAADGGTTTCGRSATPLSFTNAKAANKVCTTWDKAYNSIVGGDTVLIRSGDYSDITMPGNRSLSAAVTFAVADQQNVTVRDYTAGQTAGPNWPCNNGSGPSNITINGPIKARNVQVDCTDKVTLDGWDVDCTGCTSQYEAQMFHATTANNLIFKNGKIHDSNAVNPTGGMSYISGYNITFDNVDFYNAGATDSLVHTECMYVAGLDDITDANGVRQYALTIKNSTFYHCSYEDVFFGGSQYIVNALFENNVVERDWNQYPTGSVRNIQPIKFRDSSSDDLTPDIGRVTLRYNTFRGVVNFGTNTGTYANLYVGPLTAEGNIFLSDITNCFGSTSASWSYNAYVSKNCGGTGSFLDSSLMTTTNFVNVVNDPGDWHLKSTATKLIDKGNPTSYPATDRDGNSRFAGSAPDIGAYEYGATSGGGGNGCLDSGADVAAALSSSAAGSTICLNAGTYSGWSQKITKSSMTTVTAATGVDPASVIVGAIDLDQSSNLTLKNMTIAGISTNSTAPNARNITLSNITFTAPLNIYATQAGGANINFRVEDSDFINLPKGDNEGRLAIRGSNGNETIDNGVVIKGNTFSGFGKAKPSQCSDGIQVDREARGTQIQNNTFINMNNTTGCTAHADPIQLYGSHNHTIDGNYFKNNSTGIMNVDGNGSPGTYTNNVFATPNEQTGFYCGSCKDSTIEHNVFMMAPVFNNTNGYGLPTGHTLKNNIFMDGVSVGDGATSGSAFTTIDYNYSPDENPNNGSTYDSQWIGTHGIKNIPTFVGGASPTTYAGFALATGSAGIKAASDCSDIGIYIAGTSSPKTSCATSCSTKQGDTNNDNAVNILDISSILSAYGQTSTTSCTDVTKDGNINIQDISLVLSKYGT